MKQPPTKNQDGIAQWWEFDAGGDEIGFVMTDGYGHFAATVEARGDQSREGAFSLRQSVKARLKKELQLNK